MIKTKRYVSCVSYVLEVNHKFGIITITIGEKMPPI